MQALFWCGIPQTRLLSSVALLFHSPSFAERGEKGEQSCLHWRRSANHSTLFEGMAVFRGVRNHSGRSRLHSFNPTMHRKNECTTDIIHWESRTEWIPVSRQKMMPAAESSIHSSIRARPQRNTTQVQINCKLTIQLFNLGLFIHNFCARVQDKSFNLTTGAARFKWLIIKQQANYSKITGRTADADHEFTHSFSFTPSSELYECHTHSATFETTSLEIFSLEMCYFRTHRIAAGDELRAARGQPQRRRIVELVNNCYC